MSECVVRMKMPKDGVCDGCDARTVDSLAGPICSIKKKFLGSRRPSWCPIICQLPEGHGRLVDADMLEDGWIWGHTDRLGECECIERAEFQNAPTIVPAERSEA